MLARYLIRQQTRAYHNAAKSSQRMPAVRFANNRVKRANELRKHNEAMPRIPSEYDNPYTRYEPFPFKVTEENKLDCIRRKVTPLFDVPYEDQLASKENFCRNAMKHIGQELYKSGTPVRLNVKRLPCHVNPIVRSPQLTQYRNKDEFSIWRGVDGKTTVVGHMIFPISKHGDTVCVGPEGCDVMKSEVIEICKIFNQFLHEKAKLPVSYNLGTDGGWRRILVRVNLDGELMLIGVLNPRTLRVREVLEDRDNFRDFMIERCQEAGLKLASLYYQPCPHNSCNHKDVPYELLYGSRTIKETIGNFQIQVSPESFLHNSSIGAEVLYDTARTTISECFLKSDEGQSNPPLPIIVDSICGAGLFSLNLADLAERIIGVDKSPHAIEDAKSNAEANNVKNTEFVNADLEIVLGRILERYARQRRELIVVCDTPNAGLHPNVIEVLRHSRDVTKLLLIIPKIDSGRTVDCIVKLCSRHKGKSCPPFVPLLATPVDTCPHIEGFQTVLALERSPE